MAKAKTRKNTKEWIPSSDFMYPEESKYPKARGRTYTSGTLNEKLTGKYFSNRPDMSLFDSRPIGHGKALARDAKTVKVQRGAAVPDARRGVGQETVDGFINNQRKRKKRKTTR